MNKGARKSGPRACAYKCRAQAAGFREIAVTATTVLLIFWQRARRATVIGHRLWSRVLEKTMCRRSLETGLNERPCAAIAFYGAGPYAIVHCAVEGDVSDVTARPIGVLFYLRLG